jgi:hypothetical protein
VGRSKEWRGERGEDSVKSDGQGELTELERGEWREREREREAERGKKKEKKKQKSARTSIQVWRVEGGLERVCRESGAK